jgi:hypothetical protein
VTVPAEIILRVVELTSVEPIWLLRGEGPKFRAGTSLKSSGSESDYLAGTSVKDLLRVAIERLEENERSTVDFSYGPPIVSRKDENGEGSDQELTLGQVLGGFQIESSYFDDLSQQSRRNLRKLRVEDDAMVPIVAEGAHVTFGEAEPVSESFHEKMVVATIDGKSIVRWFQHCGKFGLLKAENTSAVPPSILVEFEPGTDGEIQTLHRVLWISTPH